VNGAGMEWDLKSAGGDKMKTNMYYCEGFRDGMGSEKCWWG